MKLIIVILITTALSGVNIKCARGCEDVNDLTDITTKTHYICGKNWCKR